MKLFNQKSKAASLLLAVAVTVSGLFIAPGTAKAAEYDTLLEQQDTAQAGIAKTYTFDVPNSSDILLDVLVAAPVDMTLNVSTANYSTTISSADWYYSSTYDLYHHPLSWQNPSQGDHTISLTFAADTTFIVFADQTRPTASISHNTLSLTKGFSQKLSVTNGTVVTWSSSNPKVAAVDSTGKVTAKSTGSSTITAKTEDGQTVSCAVSVKANTYTRTKMTMGDTRYGNAYISIPKVSYNKKGDLVIKAVYLNNCGHKIINLNNVKITVKNKSGKVIGTYTQKLKKTTILQGGQKSFTYTIKKSKLKQKSTQDLRNSTVKTSWKYKYVI